MSWYERYKHLSTAVLAALMMISQGYSIEVAAATNDVSVDAVREAIQSDAVSEDSIKNIESVSIMDFVNAIIQLEGASIRFVGPSRDTGVMQMLPSTWEEMNIRYYGGKFPYDRYKFNEKVQIMMGKQYVIHISNWLDRYNNVWGASKSFLIFATYNGGMGNIRRNAFDINNIRNNLPSVYSYAERGCNLIGAGIK